MSVKMMILKSQKNWRRITTTRWVMYDMAESREKEGECMRGKTGLRMLYLMRVKGLARWHWEVMDREADQDTCDAHHHHHHNSKF
jgi:hypothetical protein